MIKDQQVRFHAELLQFCERVSTVYNDPTVIVCGSTARGEEMPWSDVDVLVIADFREPFLSRLEELSKLNETIAPLEIVGYTPAESMVMLDRLDAKIVEALEFGLPLQSGSTLLKLRRRFDQLKEKGLTRTSCSYLLSTEKKHSV